MRRLLTAYFLPCLLSSLLTAAISLNAQSTTVPPAPGSTPVPSPSASQSASPVGNPAAKPPATSASNPAHSPASGPADPKAKETYAEAEKLSRGKDKRFALDGFRKADKQDGGHCIVCEVRAYKVALEIQDFKAAREQASLLLDNVTDPTSKAHAHYLLGNACLTEGVANKHDKPIQAADAEFQAALQLQPSKSECVFDDGLALAYLKEDGAARERFQQFVKLVKPEDLNYARAQRFAEHPELARARVAPNFRLTTLDGQTLTLESLTGKVVLIDFWATWCGPCREALPHVREIAKKFAGQPFVVVSISMDKDDAKWKDFIAKNEMSWLQYRDGYFEGPIARLFDVKAIPSTFTIDADGVLQDQHVGDADIQGKIKKLIARANEVASHKAQAAVSQPNPLQDSVQGPSRDQIKTLPTNALANPANMP